MIRNYVHLALRTAVAILLLSSLSVVAAGDYYRWLDQHGNTVLSDRPPPEGLEYEVVSAKNSSVRQVDSETSNQESEPVPPPEPLEAVKNETPSTKDPQNCEKAKSNLHELTTAPRIRMPDGNGSFRYLDDDERETERLKATKAIEVYCE